MKITIGLILGIVFGVLIIAAIVLFFFMGNILNLFQDASLQTPQPSYAPTTVSQSVTATPSQTTIMASPTFSPPAAPVVMPSPSLTPATALVPSDVIFDILNVEGSGLSRTVSGQLTNPGPVDLHNAKLKIEMYSNGKLIKNGSQNYVEKSFGDLKAGAAVTDTISIKIGIFDALPVNNNGLVFVLTFTSDEKTQTISLDYQP